MFRIGEFSKIAQVPDSQLRYYDRIGLFKPEHVDEWTGYRYYSARQLPGLHRILALKEMGLTLEQIAQLVEEEVSAAEMRGMLALRKAQVEQNLHEELARLQQIEARLQQIEAPEQAAFDVVLKTIPAQQYLSFREILPHADAALEIMGDLIRELPTIVNHDALGRFMTIIHSEAMESDRLDIELGATLLGKNKRPVTLNSNRILAVNILPEVPMMASVVRIGGFEQNCKCYGAIGLWVEDNGYQIIGPGREVLIQPPRAGLLDEMVTEIQFPVTHNNPTVSQLPRFSQSE